MYKIIIFCIITLSISFMTGCSDIRSKLIHSNTPKTLNINHDRILISADSFQKDKFINVTVLSESLSSKYLSGDYVISIDIYPLEQPSHPERHYGFWNWTFKQDIQYSKIALNNQGTITEFTINENTLSEGKDYTSWRGNIKEGDFIGYLAIWPNERPQRREVFELLKFNINDGIISNFSGKPIRKIIDFD